ncbi:2-oxoacid:acceptor oxidoreductase subunit alpha [Cryomorphaceae bacterium]|nr:2-oxoacid:acceptor oxidoreductase subunit alpha [Cryomorphaceae bacterium]
MSNTAQEVEKVTILFAGDSGDGIQLTGSQFSNTAALYGNDLSTFPDFPAEIRAPIGTVAGVSGFQINFGSTDIYTPGDESDVLVVMNAAALKKNLNRLKPRGSVILNVAGFDKRNLSLAGYEAEENPITDGTLDDYNLVQMDVTKLTRDCLKETSLGMKEKDRSKNMFVLGFVYWMYNRKLDVTIDFIQSKFGKRAPEIAEANIAVLKAGYAFGETSETFSNRFEVRPAKMAPGTYRNVMGNQATAIGVIAAGRKAGLEIFYGGYPITPASDILHELSKHKNYGVRTFQAEDEIAGICSAIGASFGGHLGVTASSGPGIALKTEALGLAVMLELPLLVINVQRGGPSTGLPTKTEQADLMQAVYGRNGEAPIPVLAARTPSDCFATVYEATRIAVEHMTPVFFLSDGYLANGAEPWMYPSADDLAEIHPKFAKPVEGKEYLPYERDEKLVREWAIPGIRDLEHRIGGLEKEDGTGNVSYDPDNHQHMTDTRQAKVDKIADYIPEQAIDNGLEKGKVLVLGWGSTFGAIKTAVLELVAEGYEVGHAHLRYLNPFPKNLAEVLGRYDHVLIPEMNNGQLVRIIRDKFLVDAKAFNKVKGIPFTAAEIKNKVAEIYTS